MVHRQGQTKNHFETTLQAAAVNQSQHKQTYTMHIHRYVTKCH